MSKLRKHQKNNSGGNQAFPRKLLLGVALLANISAVAADSVSAPKTVKAGVVGTVSTAIPGSEGNKKEGPQNQSQYSYTLEDLGMREPYELRGVDGRRSLFFSMRNDEIVTSAKLKLNYAWSPALISELSHLKVMLNDEVMTSLPLPHNSGDGRSSEVQLDPALLIDFNRLTFGLISHYTRDCEDPLHSTLWANVSNQGRLELTVRHLNLPDNLALLPAPFFDRFDSHKLNLPFVFPAQANNAVLHSAGVVASWFGGLAGYRGAQFPVLLNSLPEGNGVVFAMPDNIPASLSLPEIKGAALAVVQHPENSHAKLLVVMGRDAAELNIAAQALTLGKAALNGAFVSVAQMQDIPARKPYDAPNWIPTDRPVHIGELAKPAELQVEGLTPDKIRVNFNLPPDLFTWRSEGVPLDLHYRYSTRPQADKSTLNVNINDLFVHSLPLEAAPGKLEKSLKAAVRQDELTASTARMLIPNSSIYEQNQLQFQYYHDYDKQGSCKDVYLYNERGAVDPDTTIDFSSFPHYTALPNLRSFASAGFPYTRMADLSETAVVMPDNAAPKEMETYLQLMGFMGKVTGYPAIRHEIISPANVEMNADKDLIVIGTADKQPLLASWSDQVNVLLENGTHKLRLHGPFERLKSRWDNVDLEDAMHRAGNLITKGEGQLGALLAFESPLKGGRSVVVLTGDDAGQISTLVTSMSDPKNIERFQGDMVLQSGKNIEGFQMGPTYYVGNLPVWTSLRWHLSNQPLLLVLLIGLAALLVALVVFRYLRKLAAKRIKE